jgi:hypothetical protein
MNFFKKNHSIEEKIERYHSQKEKKKERVQDHLLRMNSLRDKET